MTITFNIELPGKSTVEIPYRAFFENVHERSFDSERKPASSEDKIIQFLKGVYVEACYRKSKKHSKDPTPYTILQNFFEKGFHTKPELAIEFCETVDEYQPSRPFQISDFLMTDEENGMTLRRQFFADILKFDQHFKNEPATPPELAEHHKQEFNCLVRYLADWYTAHKPVTIAPEDQVFPKGVDNLAKERLNRTARLQRNPRITLGGGEKIVPHPVIKTKGYTARQ